MKPRIIISLVILSLFIVNTNAQTEDYYFSKELNVSYEKAIENLKIVLKDHDLSVVSETALHESLNAKLPGINLDPYIVIGACNAKYAYEILQMEENIGLLIPCKIIVKYISDDKSEVVIMNPSVTMSVINNDEVTTFFADITRNLKKVLKAL